MSKSLEDFIFIQTLKPVLTGQESERLPPHMTALTWFSLERSLIDGVKPIMDELARQYKYDASRALGSERVMYGDNEDIPACTLVVETFAVHDALLKWVDENGGTFRHKEEYARDFSPHITDEEDVAIQPGDEINFPSLALYSYQNTPTVKRKVVEYSVQLGDQPA